ncbi:MAG: ABC transporter ATP-binding protein [Spirochaetes bacterium]|nr:ABC transporter ATP-binding protein [Spirochaetota bacterium]
MNREILRLKNLNSGYADKLILKNISFSVNEGDFISIIGPNGCGKTTLLRSISSELTPESGEIELYGKNLKNCTPGERSRLISFVFSINSKLPDYTIEQFLQLHTFPYDVPFLFKNDEKKISDAVKICGIKNSITSSIRNLSSGEFQLVQLAGACIQNSRFIILDEPVSHLDPRNAQLIMSLLRKLNASGTTIITVLHDLNIALNLPGRILGIRKGRVYFYENAAEIYNKKLTDKLYDIEFTYYRKNNRYFCLNSY